LSEAAVAAAVTVSIAGCSYVALNSDAIEGRAEKVASAATCRTVDAAIVAYVADHGSAPARVAQLRSYVKGDISAYRISKGVAAGPGC
jgi:hypothetical protein